MALDLRNALRDRRVQIGAAAAAGLGLVALARRRQTGGGGTGDAVTGSSSNAGGIGSFGAYDSSSADLANQLGQFSGALDRQLNEYGKTLNSTLDAIRKAKVPTKVPVTPTPKPKPKGKPPTPKPQSKGSSSYRIKPGDTLGAIARRNNTSVSALSRLNQIRDPNRIVAGRTLRLR